MMLKSYLKVAFRNIIRDKLNSAINLFGLSVAIAASIIIFLFARNELSYDAFNENADAIYLVYKERITPTGTQITRDTWLPMAAALRRDYPDIVSAVRIWSESAWVQSGRQRFQEDVTYTSPDLFEMFTFKLVKGDPLRALSDINSAIISQEMAEKYFGTDDPIEKSITIDYDTDYIVRGVLAAIPQNSSIQIDIAVRAESVDGYAENENNWGSSWLSTYIQVRDETSPASLEAQFPEFVTKTWGVELNQSMNLKLLPLLDLYNELSGANTYAYILIGVALVILIIAAINFMNLSTARSIERAREIGMRKVLGAIRSQISMQFLSEALLITALALGVGIGLLELFLPVFNSFYDLSLSMNYLDSFQTLLGLAALVMVIGIVSGFYPAFVMSGLKPAVSLKGRLKTSAAGLRLRFGLVITQFTLAILLIIGTAVMIEQLHFMRAANLGFDKENVVAITLRSGDFEKGEAAQVRIESFKNKLGQFAGIRSVSSSTHIPGRWPGWFTFAYPTDREDSQRLRVRQSYVDHKYFETYGIRFVEGRDFSIELATDAEQSMVINEAALRDIGWSSAEGHQVRVGSTVYNVIGVVEDYHFQSLAAEIAPILHFYRPPESGVHQVVSVKMAAGDWGPTLDFVRRQWQMLDPTRPLDFFFVDENFDRLYGNEDRLSTVSSLFSTLAIIIACLGLFALASLIVTQRTKEIGVRKALGATVLSITLLLAKVFVRIVVISFVVAVPIAVLLTQQWIKQFAYQTNIGLEIFVVSGLLVLVVALLTVSYQAIRAALANPVDTLQYE